MKRQIHFIDEEILTQISLYNLGVPTTTIAVLYKINPTTMWKRMKEYEQIGLMNFRTKSETVSITLSKKRNLVQRNKSYLIKNWKSKFGEMGLIDVLTIILLTDGWGNYKYKTLSLSNRDEVMRNIFINLLEEFNLNVSVTKDNRNDL